MRVLAIRGRNLASLAGHFELDLEAGELASVGLYAITGPVGAGKSTLLDALCLALYDRTPRLGPGGVRIGRPGESEDKRLRDRDVRTILRRGTAAGFAEVDFIGRGGVRYRARWSVRHSHGRADGRIQRQTLQLQELHGLSLRRGQGFERLRELGLWDATLVVLTDRNDRVRAEAERALALAEARGDEALANGVRERLALYRRGVAYVER